MIYTLSISLPHLMFSSKISVYSLLVPIIMMGCGFFVLIFHHLIKQLPNYLNTYGIALIFIGISVFLHTSLSAPLLLTYITGIIFIFFLSCIFHIYAIHQCLKIKTLWSHLALIITLACGFIYYFSVINPQQNGRLIVIGITTALIYLHNIKSLLHLQIDSHLKRWLRYLLYCIVIIVLTRAFTLTYLIEITDLISMSEIIWASTQLMLLFIDLVFLVLFIGCATKEIMMSLHQERNIDPLTGLLNLRGLKDALLRLPQQPYQINAILLCDLDYFKQINYLYGHYMGDLALKHANKIMIKNLRTSDLIARIGGEEFLILLQDITPETAFAVAERIRSDIQNTILVYKTERIQMTTSMGMAYFSNYHEFEDALQHANLLLCQAKNLGRNNIQTSNRL